MCFVIAHVPIETDRGTLRRVLPMGFRVVRVDAGALGCHHLYLCQRHCQLHGVTHLWKGNLKQGSHGNMIVFSVS